MMKHVKIIVLMLVFFPTLVMCPPPRTDDAARIHFLVGTVDVLSDGRKIQPVVGGVLGKNDVIETAQKSSCDLLYADMLLVRIGEQTKAVVGKIKEEMNAALNLSRGKIMVIFTRLGKESVLRVKGTTVTIAVRGTVFAFSAEETTSAVSVLDGTVEMEIGDHTRMRKIEIGPGYVAEVNKESLGDLIAGKKEISVRKLSTAEKSALIDELATIRQESVNLLPSAVRSAFDDEISKVMQSESADQKKKREAEAALRKAEEARRKAEFEALKKKQEEEERLRKEADEAARKKKEAEDAEQKRREEARKAAAKKAAQQKQKSDRSTDTSGN